MPVKAQHSNNWKQLSSSVMDSSLYSDRRRRRILVLYVGGTIGMKKNAEGALEPCAGYLTEAMQHMHELRASPEVAPFDIIEYEELLDSSDMNATDYLRIARDVQQHYEDYDGFLVAHGTDTMHFTASALSFLLHNLAKPVIVTGAMVPLAEPFNDARRNLIISMMIASNPKIGEVCIFFNDSLFRGNRCNKVYHTYGAFQSFNYPALGEMEATEFVLKEDVLLPQPTGPLSIMSDLSGRVLTFHFQPDADVETLLALLETSKEGTPEPTIPASTTEDAAHNSEATTTPAKKPSSQRAGLLDGIVIIINGVGSISSAMSTSLRTIGDTASRVGVLPCVVPREMRGAFTRKEVHRLHEICPHLLCLGDTCGATAEVKLMYLFGKHLSRSQVAELMSKNLRGELTPSTSSKL